MTTSASHFICEAVFPQSLDFVSEYINPWYHLKSVILRNMSDCLRPKSQGQEFLEVPAETRSKFFRNLVQSFQIELNTHQQKESFQVTLDFLQANK